LVFLLVSSLRVAASGFSVPVEKILSGGFPFLELLGVILAGVLIRATRGRPWHQTAGLLLLLPGYVGWSVSAGDALLPLQQWFPEGVLGLLSQYRVLFTVVSVLPLFLLGQARVVAGLFKELLPCFLMVFAYPFVPLMIRASGVADLDAALLRVDEWMFGGVNPHFWISARLHPWLTEWFALCYSLYGALILAVFGILILSDRKDELRTFVFRFVLVLAIGYSFYAWVPVQGPVFTLDFKEHLDLRYLQGVKEALMDRARIERDCFPSLHTALSLLAWGTLAGVSVRLGRILIPVVISIPVACVYLRYHYVIDVVAGAGLVSGVLWSTKKRRQGGSPA
jgi:membrane-associated phospholipid phosphatase